MMTRLFPLRTFFERRSSDYRQRLKSHNQELESKVTHWIHEHAKSTADGLMKSRGNKLQREVLPNKEALIEEIAANRMKEFVRVGRDLRFANRGDPMEYTDLTLGFSSYVAAQALKGPVAVKHRLGEWSSIVGEGKVFEDRKALNFEAKRLGRFFNNIGVRRLITPHTHSVMLAGVAGQTGHLLGIHTPITSLVLKIADYLPFFSRVPGWFSNHMKVHMMRKDIGPYAAFALKLRSREGPSAAKSLQAASRAASSEQPPQGAHPEAVPAHPRH